MFSVYTETRMWSFLKIFTQEGVFQKLWFYGSKNLFACAGNLWTRTSRTDKLNHQYVAAWYLNGSRLRWDWPNSLHLFLRWFAKCRLVCVDVVGKRRIWTQLCKIFCLESSFCFGCFICNWSLLIWWVQCKATRLLSRFRKGFAPALSS